MKHSLTLLFAALWPVLLSAQSLHVVELEPFYVSVPQRGMAQEDVAGQQWRSRGVVGLAELLEDSEPGLALVRKAGMSNDVVMRGLGGDDVSVTLDGRKIYCACSNRMDPPLSHATAEVASKVEVAAGPFSLKRAGSLAGHVNVVSEPIQNGEHGRFEARYGSFSEAGFSSWVSTGDEDFAVRVQAGWLSGDPYENGDGVRMTEMALGKSAFLPEVLDDKAYEAWHAGAELRWRLKDSIQMTANALRREDSDVLFAGLKMDADHTRTNQLGLRFEDQESSGRFDHWTADVYYNETDHLMSDRRRLTSLNGPGGRGWFMVTDARSSNFGVTFDAGLETNDFGSWEIGAEFDRRLWDSDNVIGPNQNDMLPDTTLDTTGVYAEGRYELSDTRSLEVGLRIDRFAAGTDGDTTFLRTMQGTDRDREYIEPGAFVSLRQELGERTAVFVGLGSIARAPNPQELYIQVDKPMANPDWVGNPDLDAPRSNELTAGWEYAREDLLVRARVFHAWLDGYIYPVKVTTPSTFQSYDNVDARLYGVELKTEYSLAEHWSLGFALAWQQGEKRSRPDNSSNDVLAEIPPLRAQASLKYADVDTEISFEARASQGQGRTDSDLFEQDMGSWFTFSIRGRQQLDEHWSLSLAVENLLDETYALHNSQVRNPFSAFTVVDEPGRVLKLSLSYEF